MGFADDAGFNEARKLELQIEAIIAVVKEVVPPERQGELMNRLADYGVVVPPEEDHHLLMEQEVDGIIRSLRGSVGLAGTVARLAWVVKALVEERRKDG